MGRTRSIPARIATAREERHRMRREADRQERHIDRIRAEAMIQRGWI
ncbi:hypothetical protein OVA14_03375 [Agrococcus sp. SL85]|nr:hypothetical protein [Agrococcus sp. SL85]WAC66823.1 hypothetical protein OVA14_03375 [Agrococcus sp. SL85]